MAYISKRTGKEIDELLDRVEQGGGGASIVVDTELSETSNNAIANSAVAKALGRMATKEELEVVQEETNENSKTLEYLIKSETKDISPTIAYEDSEVINGQVSTYKNYQVSAPIFLNKGEIISLTSYSGGGTQAISLTDANGSFYTSIDDTSGYKTRTYTAIKDCYVALSWLNAEDIYPRTLTITRMAIIPAILDKLDTLATPSGDPLHYAYENSGALYNATDTDITFIGVYGETITHKANHWRLNDLGDISSEEMQKIFNIRYPSLSGYYLPMWFGGNGNVSTNICNTQWSSSFNMHDCFVNNYTIKSISLAADVGGVALPLNLAYSFYAAQSLHTIINRIDLTWAALQTTTFGGCYSLKNIRLLNLHSDISFADSPLLSKESLLYMIENCAEGVSFTITLHPDVDDKWQSDWLEEIDSALGRAESAKNTNITLARA